MARFWSGCELWSSAEVGHVIGKDTVGLQLDQPPFGIVNPRYSVNEPAVPIRLIGIEVFAQEPLKKGGVHFSDRRRSA